MSMKWIWNQIGHPRQINISICLIEHPMFKSKLEVSFFPRAAPVSATLSKGGIADALATKSGLKKSEISKLLESFTDLATAEVKKAGKFTIPGLCMLKTRIKPARKAGTMQSFGKTIKVKAAPAKKIVKALCVSALKKSI